MRRSPDHTPSKQQRILIGILKDNRDAICSELMCRYVEDYPASKANQLGVRYREEWSSRELDNLICALQTNDFDHVNYKKMFGDIFRDPYHPELSQLSTALSELVFESSVVATFIMRHEMPEDVDADQLLSYFESFIQHAVSYNCTLYAHDVLKPGSLVSAWQMNYFQKGGAERGSTSSHRAESMSQQDGRQVNGIRRQRRLSALTRRERQVLELVLQGKTNGEIAAQLHVSQNTVKNHVAHLLDKMNVSSRTELIIDLLQK